MKKFLYPFLLVIITSAIFIFFLIKDRSFFIKDDIISYSLPYFKLQGEMIFNYHQLPFINYYQFLGHPILPQGQTQVFYLPVYLFYLIAEIFHNPELIITLSAYFHIILSALSMYILLRTLKIPKRFCLLGAIAYSNNGFLIQMGKNWIVVTAYFAYLPLIYTVLILKLNNLKKILALSLLNSVVFFVGNPNFYLYTILFESLFILFYKPKISYWLNYLHSSLITIIIVLPQLLPMMAVFLKSSRIFNFNENFISSINITYILQSFFFLPCKTSVYNQSCYSIILFNPLNFISMLLIAKLLFTKIINLIILNKKIYLSTLLKKPIAISLSLLLFSRIIQLLINYHTFSLNESILNIFSLEANIILLLEWGSFLLIASFLLKNKQSLFKLFLLFFIISTLLSTGIKTLYSNIFFLVIKYFRWPFKWYFLSQFFLSIVSTLLISKYLKLNRLLFIIFCLLIVIFSISVNQPFNTDLNPNFSTYSKISNLNYLNYIKGRSVPVGIQRDKNNLFTKMLSNNSATYFNKLSFIGIDADALITKKISKIIDLNHMSDINSNSYYYQKKDYLDAYGVRFYLFEKNRKSNINFLNNPNFKNIYEDNDLIIYENIEAKPLIFLEKSSASLPYKINGNKITISSTKAVNDKIIVGFLKEDNNWRVYTKNRDLQLSSDKNDRINIQTNNIKGEITLEYIDNLFILGLKISSVLLTAYLIGIVIYLRIISRSKFDFNIHKA